MTHHSVTLSLCDSVVNKQSNNSAALHPIGPKFFWGSFGQKRVSQIFYIVQGLVGQGLRAKKILISQAISAIWQGIGLNIKY